MITLNGLACNKIVISSACLYIIMLLVIKRALVLLPARYVVAGHCVKSRDVNPSREASDFKLCYRLNQEIVGLSVISICTAPAELFLIIYMFTSVQISHQYMFKPLSSRGSFCTWLAC
jgi:hypothetical protein